MNYMAMKCVEPQKRVVIFDIYASGLSTNALINNKKKIYINKFEALNVHGLKSD